MFRPTFENIIFGEFFARDGFDTEFSHMQSQRIFFMHAKTVTYLVGQKSEILGSKFSLRG